MPTIVSAFYVTLIICGGGPGVLFSSKQPVDVAVASTSQDRII